MAVGFVEFRNFPSVCVAVQGEFKPHVVPVKHSLKPDLEDVADWLNTTDGVGYCSLTTEAALDYHIRVNVNGEEGYMQGDAAEKFVFLFTDPNTAFHFKFRWA